VSDFSAEEIRVLKALVAFVQGAARGTAPTAPATSGNGSAKPAASDDDLNGRYGDPSVRKDPKRWAGASCVGLNYSACPSDYLLLLAEYLEWGADKDAAKPEPPKHANGTLYFEYARKDARLARGWARRNEGKPARAAAPANGAGVDDPYASRDEVVAEDEIPF
jgi:hypothetical protein